MLKKPTKVMMPTTGSRIIDNGMNGSGAVSRRTVNSAQSASEAASNPRIGSDSQR